MIPGDNSHPASSIKPIIDKRGTSDIIIPYTDNKGKEVYQGTCYQKFLQI